MMRSRYSMFLLGAVLASVAVPRGPALRVATTDFVSQSLAEAQASTADIHSRVKSVLNATQTWEHTFAFVAPRVKALGELWRERFNGSFEEIMHSSPGSNRKPFFMVAIVGGKPYFYSPDTARGNGVTQELEFILGGQGIFFTMLARVFPNFPPTMFGISYGKQHGTYLPDNLPFPGFGRAFSPLHHSNVEGWPINAELLQSCAVSELERSHSDFIASVTKPWEERDDRALFRGRPSSPQRWRLAQIAEGPHKALFDVIVNNAIDTARHVKHGSEQPFKYSDAFSDERNHKYTIYAEGSTAAWRVIRMLASGVRSEVNNFE